MEYGLQLGKEMASSDMVQSENGSGTTLIVSDMNITGLQDGGLTDEGYDSPLLMPPWEIALTVLALSGVIALTIVGNILVILSVFTYKPLRIVQNFFIVSLAVADLTVAVFVLPFNVAYIIIGKWVFGIHLCEMWLTFDILCCTASILNLCAIALDRYWAITDPLNYAQKRTLKRVMIMIASVWIISVIICLPPLFGWNDWPEVFTEETRCMLTQQKGFIIYSSSGSFYLPLVIMSIVYLKIFLATKRRLRERAQASKLNQINSNKRIGKDDDSVMSENGQNGYNDSYKRKLVMKKRKKKRGGDATTSIMSLAPPPGVEESVTEQDVSPIKTEAPPLCRQESDKAEVVVKMIPGGRSQIHQFIEEKQKISLSKERRAARTLGIIMGVFVVCWLPFFLMYVILPFCPACPKPSDKVINFITWLGYINSALNPMIYTIFNLDFRRAFARILKCSNLVAV